MIILDAVNYLFDDYWVKEKPLASSENLIKELVQCPSSQALIEEAQKIIKELGQAALDIRLEQTTCGFRAETQGNIIRINPNLSASEQRYCAIFELTNVIQAKEFCKLIKATIDGMFKSSEDYVRASELIEYNGVKRAKIVSKEINKEKGCFFRPYVKIPSEYLPIDLMGFNIYYNLLVSNKHKESHRYNWRKTIKAFNIVTADHSCVPNKNKELCKKIFLDSLVVSAISLGAFATLFNFYRVALKLTLG